MGLCLRKEPSLIIFLGFLLHFVFITLQEKASLKFLPTVFVAANALMLATPLHALAETCEADKSVFNMPLLLFVSLVGATVGGKVLKVHADLQLYSKLIAENWYFNSVAHLVTMSRLISPLLIFCMIVKFILFCSTVSLLCQSSLTLLRQSFQLFSICSLCWANSKHGAALCLGSVIMIEVPILYSEWHSWLLIRSQLSLCLKWYIHVHKIWSFMTFFYLNRSDVC